LIQAVVETLQFEAHKLANSVWSKEELPDQWKIQFTRRALKLTALIAEKYHGYTEFYAGFVHRVKSHI
jgi:hypothetical protein